MSRLPLVAANWKMHSPPAGWEAADSPFESKDAVEVVVFPSLLDVQACERSGLITGAQYSRPEKDGAFTGDVSMNMIADHGCDYVLCGHSERREHHHESDQFIAQQVEAALDAGLTPILCIGETSDERELTQQKDVISLQLEIVLKTLDSRLPTVVIAYEPVWAIGSGKTASAEDAQEMHAFIRSLLPDAVRDDMRIIYGGSVKPDNAAQLIAQQDIDGFLVGGASLKPKEFAQIVDAAGMKA